MRKLIVFNQVSLDGYFVDATGDMSWAHKDDPEWNAFASENASGGGELLFGRVSVKMAGIHALEADLPDQGDHGRARGLIVRASKHYS
jgi:hypothetical protein